MQLITTDGLSLTEQQEALVQKKVDWLKRYYPRILSCRVAIDAPVRHHRDGGPYQVRIDLKVPGSDLAVTNQAEEEFAVAVREAFDAARRRLADYARRQRGATKVHEPPPLGRVTQLFPMEDYGILETMEGRPIYFHRNSVLPPGFDRLAIGAEVRFAEEPGDKGPQASSVIVVEQAKPMR